MIKINSQRFVFGVYLAVTLLFPPHGVAGGSDDVQQIRELASQGNIEAQNMLAQMSLLGEGTKYDAKEAAKWYARSAEAGDAEGQYNLGNLYRTGLGVEKDLKAAASLYHKAADQKYSLAFLALGDLYAGSDQLGDLCKARVSYESAIDLGHEEARPLLGQINNKIGDRKCD